MKMAKGTLEREQQLPPFFLRPKLVAHQRYVYFTFLCGFLFIRISKNRGGGLKCAHLRATPLRVLIYMWMLSFHEP